MVAGTGLKLVDLGEDGVDRAFRSDVLDGLSEPQKAVPARWLYDDAGSQLFEDITKVSEYYPTRAETEILENRSMEFSELIGPDRAIVEFGSGSSVKTPLLLRAISRRPMSRLIFLVNFCALRPRIWPRNFPVCLSIPSKLILCARSPCPMKCAIGQSWVSSPVQRSAIWSRALRSICLERCAIRWAKDHNC